MSAEAKIRILCEGTGLGDDNKVSNYSLLSDTPTQMSGPVYQSLTTVIDFVDLVSVVTGELVALYVKSVTSNIFVSLVSALNTTQCLFVPQGQANLYTFQSTISARPVARATISSAKIETWIVAIS